MNQGFFYYEIMEGIGIFRFSWAKCPVYPDDFSLVKNLFLHTMFS